MAELGAPVTDPTKLENFLKWMRGGFALLVGVTTFFGIQRGVLGRVVRIYPEVTMVVPIFVGIGVIFRTDCTGRHAGFGSDVGKGELAGSEATHRPVGGGEDGLVADFSGSAHRILTVSKWSFRIISI